MHMTCVNFSNTGVNRLIDIFQTVLMVYLRDLSILDIAALQVTAVDPEPSVFINSR